MDAVESTYRRWRERETERVVEQVPSNAALLSCSSQTFLERRPEPRILLDALIRLSRSAHGKNARRLTRAMMMLSLVSSSGKAPMCRPDAVPDRVPERTQSRLPPNLPLFKCERPQDQQAGAPPRDGLIMVGGQCSRPLKLPNSPRVVLTGSLSFGYRRNGVDRRVYGRGPGSPLSSTALIESAEPTVVPPRVLRRCSRLPVMHDVSQ